MKRLALAWGIACALLVTASARQIPAVGTGASNGSIEVTVRDGKGDPLPDLEVKISSANSALQSPGTASSTSSTAVTHGDGRVLFRGLKQGTYEVRAERLGYMVVGSIGNVNKAAIALIDLGDYATSTAKAAKINFVLVAGGIIFGIVRNAKGRPLSGIHITAMLQGYWFGQKYLTEARATSVVSAESNDLGEFRIFWLPPGEYYLRTERTDENRQDQGDYGAEIYIPGTTDIALATRLTLKEGQEVNVGPLVIPPARGVKVSGTVTSNIPGARPSDFVVTPEIPGFVGRQRSVGAYLKDQVKGESEFPFEISGIPPGRYLLESTFKTEDDSGYIGATSWIDVGTEDLRGITLPLRKGVDIHARVSMPAEVVSFLQRYGRPPGYWLGFIFFPLPLRGPDSHDLRIEASTEGKERFEFPLFSAGAGRYRLAFLNPLPADAFLSDMRQDGRSVYNDGTIEIGDSAVQLDLAIGRNGGTIQGTVAIPQSGSSSDYVAVALIPEKVRRGNLLLYKRQDVSVISSDNAKFKFTGVAPGNYRILALDYLLAGGEMNPEIIAEYESSGVAVKVSAGTTLQDIQPRLIRTK